MGSVAGKSNTTTYMRRAHHAGSWYEDDKLLLRKTLEGFLNDTSVDADGISTSSIAAAGNATAIRAVIVPHAGYSYSGPTAAAAYKLVQQELSNADTPIRKILVLHPSHHVYLPGTCAVSNAAILQTPVGDLHVDDELRQEIVAASPKFKLMSKMEDEHEHSGEMQYPYLAHVIKDCKHKITVTPVMCGSLKTPNEIDFGKLLGGIIARRDVLTVVSTDFCHWGRRFDYQPVGDDSIVTSHEDGMPIYKFIEQLDRTGMNLIELQQPGAFADYLKTTKNTVCGRHAVSVWLRAVESSSNNDELTVSFIKYAQSSQCKSTQDSSVSYAAAVATSTRTNLSC